MNIVKLVFRVGKKKDKQMTGRDICIALWVTILWSGAIIAQKIALVQYSIFTWNFLRVAMVFPFIFFFPKPQNNFLQYCLCGFFLFAIYPFFLGVGLQSSLGAGMISFFLQTQVFFVVLCGIFLLKEKPTWYQLIGILISFVGIYFMKASSTAIEVPLLGVLFLFASGLFFGMGVVLSKKYKLGKNLADVIWLSSVSLGPLLLACFIAEGPQVTFENIIHISPTVFLCLIFTSLFSIIWATYLWLTLLQRVSITAATPFMLLVPIFVNILSLLFLGEELSLFQIVSGLIIILGVIFAQGFYAPLLTMGLRLRKKYD
ncbi:MAG: EamA family transporter [Alphaproteobacteria bacterium]|nr:EamA family transporter [Alphaproteobacteria bacterium]